jgi:hypothetical protein
MRFYLFLLVFTTSLLQAQLSNVRQTVENGRIIITYDLSGNDEDIYNISVAATHENGQTIKPRAIVGDLVAVTPGEDRSIWWQTPLDGLTPAGWKISLSAKKSIRVSWVFVQGGPTGDFYISATKVTFEQFDNFCDATGYKKPSADFGRGKQPVIYVNVADAQAFCSWLSEETRKIVRLPEENEWEYAAKGGSKSRGFEYSGSNSVDDVAWYNGNSERKTHEVGTKKPNELGIYDMSGNVWELCGTSGAIRGGSWSTSDGGCRVSFRYVLNPDLRGVDGGFRVVQK